jgi:hypothetical protein
MAADEDLSQLLNMVFSPDADNDVMLGACCALQAPLR